METLTETQKEALKQAAIKKEEQSREERLSGMFATVQPSAPEQPDIFQKSINLPTDEIGKFLDEVARSNMKFSGSLIER